MKTLIRFLPLYVAILFWVLSQVANYMPMDYGVPREIGLFIMRCNFLVLMLICVATFFIQETIRKK